MLQRVIDAAGLEIELELRQLRYFVKIAEMGGISRAAAALHISQPSLSHQISQLEDELGKELLTRLPSGVRMTVEGEAFYCQALQILRQIDNLQAVVLGANAQLSGRVKLSMAHTQAVQYALTLILKVREMYPGIELEVFDNTSSDVMQGVASGQCDFGMVVKAEHAALLDSEAVIAEEMFLISHPQQVPQANPFPRSSLASLPLAVPVSEQLSRADAELFGSTSINIDERRRLGKRIFANSVTIVRQAALEGVAYAVLPWGAIREELVSGRLRATSISPMVVRTIYICSCRGSNMSQAARAVKALLLTVIKEEITLDRVRAQLIVSREME